MTTAGEPPWPNALRVKPDVPADAIVVVPGIMGSELVDTDSGAMIWGLRDLRWYLRAWSRGTGLAPLAVTPDEREGNIRRVKATGVLRFPAFAPLLAGFEPYTKLVDTIKETVAHPSAVLEFAYDWRLSVQHNSAQLETAAARHLELWRARSGRHDAKLLLVAHSMGGLLCRALAARASDEIRAIVTLGTPFDGAAKAAIILGTGQGAPLPKSRLRTVAATMPGMYELLPTYRCVDDGDTVRTLTPDDIARLGGDRELAVETFDARAEVQGATLPGHAAIIGVEQPTISSLTLDGGVITGHGYTFRLHPDGEFVRAPNGVLERLTGLGDGTVPRNSALPPGGVTATPLAQQHGPIAQSPETITFVRDLLRHGQSDIGPRLGDGDIGFDLPDVVDPGREWIAPVIGVNAPHQATATVVDAETGEVVDRPTIHRRDGTFVIAATQDKPGIYRVNVGRRDTPTVTQLLMVIEPPP